MSVLDLLNHNNNGNLVSGASPLFDTLKRYYLKPTDYSLWCG